MKTETKLTPKQELFCQLYASDREFFGNGVQSYIEAYDVDVTTPGKYASARSAAHENLTKHDILARINELLEDGILNDQFVDKQLAFIISQNAEMSVKMQAIKEYNALKQRVTKKLDVTSDGNPMSGLSVEELRDLIKGK